MKFNFILTVFTLAILSVSSCSDDKDNSNATIDQFSSGVFVANEGPFGSGTGTISFINNEDNTIVDQVFASANDGLPLGNIVNDIEIRNNYAVIVVNNANKVVIADKRDMSLLHEINDIPLPRFATFINDTECMVSYWGADGVSGGIVKIDVEQGSIVEDIPLRSGPERMLFKSEKLFVTISGGFGLDSVVQILNPTDASLIDEVVVGDNPIDLVSGMGESVWVLSRGFTDFYDPTANTEGRILRLNAQNEIRESFAVANGSSNIEIDLDNNQLYYVNGLFGLGRIGSFINDMPVFLPIQINGTNSYPYSLKYDDSRDILYAADAVDFQSNGFIYLLENGDNLIRTYDTGVIPSAIELVD